MVDQSKIHLVCLLVGFSIWPSTASYLLCLLDGVSSKPDLCSTGRNRSLESSLDSLDSTNLTLDSANLTLDSANLTKDSTEDSTEAKGEGEEERVPFDFSEIWLARRERRA